MMQLFPVRSFNVLQECKTNYKTASLLPKVGMFGVEPWNLEHRRTENQRVSAIIVELSTDPSSAYAPSLLKIVNAPIKQIDKPTTMV